MGKLLNFFENNRRLFIVRKHQNGKKQEKYRLIVIRSFFTYCENNNNIYHTNQITPSVARKFLNEHLKGYSAESKRQYSLVIRHFFERFLKKEINL